MSKLTKLHWYAATPKNGIEPYELWNDNKLLLTLYFNQFSQTAKVVCEDSRRNFKIDKEGFFRNKTIIKNEYGIKIGELGSVNWFGQEGFIDLNGERFLYTTQNNPMAEVVMYKKNKHRPIISCGLVANNGNTEISFQKNKDPEKYSCILMALCWFLFMPVAKENVVEYAA
jgi:hypothetical protein